MSDSDFEKITPMDFSPDGESPAKEANRPPPLGLEEIHQLENYQQQNRTVLWGIFSLLLILVLGVVFILPNYISTPTLEQPKLDTPVATAAGQPGEEAEAPPGLSPYQEAQRLKQRGEAQEVLAEVLELQDELELKSVRDWASEDFDAAIAKAKAGDEAYREQDFISAKRLYGETLILFQAIEGHIPAVLADTLQQGEAALQAGLADDALTSFRLALRIDARNTAADTGLQRALVLEDVLALLEQGETLYENGRLDAAREAFQKALTSDSQHPRARQLLEQTNKAILERDFQNLMSNGYQELQADRADLSEQAFKKALALKPESEEARIALQQSQDRISMGKVNSHQSLAEGHVAAERWQQALEEYEAILAIDPNLVFAQEGKEKADLRQRLDLFLETTLAEPLRLADEAAYRQNLNIYRDALGLPESERGPRLNTQLEKLSALLTRAKQPVSVQLQSDGLTHVSIYRIAELGQFTSHSLSLTPGKYVAVGVREGYRDVREEFTVAFDGKPQTVTIACQDAI